MIPRRLRNPPEQRDTPDAETVDLLTWDGKPAGKVTVLAHEPMTPVEFFARPRKLRDRGNL